MYQLTRIQRDILYVIYPNKYTSYRNIKSNLSDLYGQDIRESQVLSGLSALADKNLIKKRQNKYLITEQGEQKVEEKRALITN